MLSPSWTADRRGRLLCWWPVGQRHDLAALPTSGSGSGLCAFLCFLDVGIWAWIVTLRGGKRKGRSCWFPVLPSLSSSLYRGPCRMAWWALGQGQCQLRGAGSRRPSPASMCIGRLSFSERPRAECMAVSSSPAVWGGQWGGGVGGEKRCFQFLTTKATICKLQRTGTQALQGTPWA